MAHEPEPPRAAFYTTASPNSPPLTVDVEQIQALQALADDASTPGQTVIPSDLIAEAIGTYLDDRGNALKGIAKQAEEAELECVALAHGGEAA
jgi:hypothetical protein